ncbi:MAG: hypothetical protein MZV70_29825 [Desulfobacterales bacterium]|nr:hypothetical protein [Desulfobacterales bacterium]
MIVSGATGGDRLRALSPEARNRCVPQGLPQPGGHLRRHGGIRRLPVLRRR